MNNNPSVYEINTRVWLKRFGVKSLLEVPEKYWQDLKEKGFDFIWLMGVWKACDSVVEKYCFEDDLVKSYERALKDWQKTDVIGSPFAIDKYEINPMLGEGDDLKKLRKKLNNLGLGLILDFIPNHFGAGSSIIKTNPEVFLPVDKDFYGKESHTYFKPDNSEKYFAHGRDPFFPAWQDTIQVNYYNETARKFMTDVLLELTNVCDGVRCDMAMLMLNNVFKNTWAGIVSAYNLEIPATEFWSDAIKTVKSKRRDFVFIAEAYWDLEWELQQQGFNYTYDKRMTDRMRFGNVAGVRDHLHAGQIYQRKSVRFIENHDETRALSALGKEREKAAAVIMSTIQGMKLFYDGQFEGKKIKLPVQLGREPNEPVVEDLKVFYDNLLSITKQEIFKNGNWLLLQTGSSWENNETFKNLLAWQLVLNDEKRIVIVNYSDIFSSCRIKLDMRDYPEEFVLKDLLNGQAYTRSSDETFIAGLYVELKPWHSHIFSF